jgi:hypothetical protein
MIANAMLADVAELADALDLGSSTVRCEGSSPFVRIDNQGKCYQTVHELVHLIEPHHTKAF